MVVVVAMWGVLPRKNREVGQGCRREDTVGRPQAKEGRCERGEGEKWWQVVWEGRHRRSCEGRMIQRGMAERETDRHVPCHLNVDV